MARDKMNWGGWVDGVQVVVFSKFRAHGIYSIKIMISRENIPNNPITTPWATPWKTGKVQEWCKGHEVAARSTFKYVKQWFEKYGNPFVGPPLQEETPCS